MEKNITCELTGTELEFAFAKAMQYEMLGSKKGPFALHSTSEPSIYIFGGAKESVSVSSFTTDFSEIPLHMGKKLGAALYMENGVAKCRLGDFSTDGEDYMEALMRALVIHFSSRQE